MTVIHDIRNRTQRTNGTRPESAIKNIARHHSGTETGDFFSFWSFWNGSRGWGTGGYHEIILRDGSVQICYNPNEITNGIANHNTNTYHICVVGNGSFTAAQERTFKERCLLAMKRFNLPASAVKGHREFSGQATACPGINMNQVRSSLQSKVIPVSMEVIDPMGKGYLWETDRGVSVSALQANLNTAGAVPQLVVDGQFGPATKAAVTSFQRKHNLTADGVYGAKTDAKMKQILAVAAAPTPGMSVSDRKGEVRLRQAMNYRRGPGTSFAVIRQLPANHTCHYYEIQGDWVRLGIGWVSNVDNKYVVFTKKYADQKPVAKKTLYRVVIDGKSVGAFGETDNVINAAKAAIGKGAKDIKIEKV